MPSSKPSKSVQRAVLILCGGRSAEHEISLISAKHILAALDRELFAPIVVGIAKDGSWYLEEEKTFYRGEAMANEISLNLDAPKVTLAPYSSKSGRGCLFVNGREIEFDVAFPILHGPFGEDGTMQGLFEIMGIPYVGSNCGSSWICMDKWLTKTICAHHGVPVAPFVGLISPDQIKVKEQGIRSLGECLFVKPARLGSSVGISKVNHFGELQKAVGLAFQYDSKIIIESAIVGREIECAVLGRNQNPKAALPGEIIPSAKVGWYSYEAKYIMKDGAQLHTPAKLAPELISRAQQFAIRAFQLLECDGMARVDLFLDRNDLFYLNEINTIPGFTPISMYPKLWQVSGMNYTALLTELLNLAFERRGGLSSSPAAI